MKKSQKELCELAEHEVLVEYTRRVGVTPIELIEPNKSMEICDLRCLYYKLRHENHGLKYTKIEEEVNRHHTTISRGVKRISIVIKYDERIAACWEKVKDIPDIPDITKKHSLPAVLIKHQEKVSEQHHCASLTNNSCYRAELPRESSCIVYAEK